MFDEGLRVAARLAWHAASETIAWILEAREKRILTRWKNSARVTGSLGLGRLEPCTGEQARGGTVIRGDQGGIQGAQPDRDDKLPVRAISWWRGSESERLAGAALDRQTPPVTP